ncbi:MAG: ribonuclease H-like domain-containing protein [Candidatus Dormibacteria bacterium]
MLDHRAVDLRTLRDRIAELGGAPGGPLPARRPPPASPSAERAATLGFQRRADATYVRSEIVDLGPALSDAGMHDAIAVPSITRMCGIVADTGAHLGVLDIECLGLRGSGVVAFLIGLGVQRGTSLAVDQYLLVDMAEEAAQLGAVARAIRSQPAWLTYNGRSFDVPVLRARCVVNRLDPESVEPRVHADVLGVTRRLFRERLGACTLQRAERSILNHHRVDDTPGAEAPARYRAWLNGAPPAVFAGVVRHNLRDLVSTAVLAARLAAHVDGATVNPEHPADPLQRAHFLERRGFTAEAVPELRRTFDAGVEPWSRRAGHRLAFLLQRQGDPEGALRVWQRLLLGDGRDLVAARGCAIRLERCGEHRAALDVVEQVWTVRDAMGPWWSRMRGGGARATLEWQRREHRLRRRIGADRCDAG